MPERIDEWQKKMITDGKVDEILFNHGIENGDIYYSPRAVYVYTIGGAGIGILQFLLLAFWQWPWLLIPFILYCIGIYFANNYLNNSFSLSSNELVVVNSSRFFPFFKIYKLADITMIRRKVHRFAWMHFLLLPSSYIEVHVSGRIYKYYCIWLEDDYFDENKVYKTMDSFEISLNNLGVKTDFWYPY